MLPDEPEAAVAFAYSPLQEAVLSLHVLVEPKHHALQHEWVRAMRTLRPSLRREIGALAFLYKWTLPNCVLPSATTGYDGFDVELARFRKLPVDVVASELLRPLYDHGGAPSRTRVLRDAKVRAVALRQAGRLGPPARRAAALLFDDPAELVDRFARLLESYWQEAFEREWQAIEPKLADTVAAAGRQIAGDGIGRFLLGLAPQLRIDPGARSFGLDVPHEHRVPVGPETPLVLIPSVYVWPHVRVNCDSGWPLALIYRAPFLVEHLRHGSPPELVRGLRALADPTRLRIMQLVARRPRSTQELAPLLRLTEAGASKHLRMLADAGLLETRREGYYVLYSLTLDRLEQLAADLRHLVAADEHDQGENLPGTGLRA